MGFWKPTSISWQAEIWVLGNLYMGVVKRKGGYCNSKRGGVADAVCVSIVKQY